MGPIPRQSMKKANGKKDCLQSVQPEPEDGRYNTLQNKT